MKLQPPRSSSNSFQWVRVVPWDWPPRWSGSALAVGGGLLLASLVVPFGLAAFVSWASTSGLVLVGSAVLAIGGGLLGLAPTTTDGRSATLATAGIALVVLSGAGAVALTAMGVVALGGDAFGLALGAPKAAFMLIALATAAGLALALVAIGAARWMADGSMATTPGLLVAGGAVLLIPVFGEVARRVVGSDIPSWFLFPALLGVSLAVLTAGLATRRTHDQKEVTTR